MFLGPKLVAWHAKKQNTVSCSSCEAEYCSLASATTELHWLKFLLHKLKVPSVKLAVTQYDNESAIALTYNPVLHACTKHIDVDVHLVHERIETKHLIVSHVSSLAHITDIFTKPLSTSRFQILYSKLTVMDSLVHLQGDVRDKHQSVSLS